MGIWNELRQLPFSRRQKRAKRAKLSLSDFVKSASKNSFEGEVAREIWTHLKNFIVSPEFSSYPEDSLGYYYGIAEEELDEDLILSLLRRFDIPPPPYENVMSFGKIDTPRQVIEFISFAKSLSKQQ